MIVRKTTKEEARRINELFAICFEFPYTNCPIEDPETDDCNHCTKQHTTQKHLHQKGIKRLFLHLFQFFLQR